MEFIKLNKDEAKEKFQEFYDGSALTVEGMLPEEAPLYIEFLEQHSKVDHSVNGYIFEGPAMNEYYNLKGKKKYPEDMHFMVVPLKAFKNVGAIAIPRFTFGGRWFDDVVDNNAA